MLTVFLREFKAIFRNIKCIVCLTIFALCSGILFVSNNLSTGYTEIEPVLSSMTLVAALTVPLIAIFSVSKERKEGSGAFLAVMPFTRAQIIIGKFLAVLASFAIPLAAIALYPIILGFLGVAKAGNSYASFIVLCALVAFLSAFGMMLALLFKRAWKAIVVSYALLSALFLLGTIAVIFECSALVGFIFFSALSIALGLCAYFAARRVSLSAIIALAGIGVSATVYFAVPTILINSIEKFLKFVSPFRRFDSVVFGIFDVSSLIFYLSSALVFLWFAALGMNFKKPRKKGQKRAGAKKKVSLAATALILLCLLLNVTASALPSTLTQIDISDNKLYSVSENTKSFIKSLDGDITVYMVDKTGADERVIRYIQRYCSISNKITLKEINTQKDTEFLSKYGIEDETLPYASLIVESDSRWRIVSSEEYFTYYHEQLGYVSPSDLEYYISYYSQMYSQYSASSQASSDDLNQLQEIINSLSYDSVLCFCAEQSITEAVEYVSRKYIPAIYFLSGHGEKNTSTKPLDIRGLSAIPEDVGLLIVNCPTEDYSASEIEVLLRFMEGGGRAVFLTNAANNSMPNLSRLLACYGLKTEAGVISKNDSTKIETVSNTSSSTKVSLTDASIINSIDVEGIITAPLLTVDIEEADSSTEENKTESKSVAVVAYRGENPTLALITGADTFNVSDATSLSDTEKQEYLVAMSFLQSVSTGMKKGFESALSFPTAIVYEIEVITIEKSSALIFGTLFAAIVPITVLCVPIFNIYVRKKRSSAPLVAE